MAKGIFGEIIFKTKSGKTEDDLLDKANDMISEASLDRLKRMAFEVDATAKKLIQRRSSGITYKRGNITHVASKPGDPPNIDTGRLINSIDHNVDKLLKIATIGTNLEYGKFLEFGTKHIAARPWLSRAFRAITQRFKNKDLKSKGPTK